MYGNVFLLVGINVPDLICLAFDCKVITSLAQFKMRVRDQTGYLILLREPYEPNLYNQLPRNGPLAGKHFK
jgi:hypothetical protein